LNLGLSGAQGRIQTTDTRIFVAPSPMRLMLARVFVS